MVEIKDYVLRENSEGEEFFALIVESGFEVANHRKSGECDQIAAAMPSEPEEKSPETGLSTDS